jgi:oligopeptide/dipeptide ABC transporter ATP-binding protein
MLAQPEMNGDPLLELRNVTKTFQVYSGLLNHRSFTAVDNASLQVFPGQTIGLVGESGSGKTTVARLALGLLRPTAGKVLFEGKDLNALNRVAWRLTRLRVQPVFQDPYSSLNPRQTIHDIVRAPLEVHRIYRRGGNRQAVIEELHGVGLGPQYIDRLPHQLSGGERQRVNIARALILRPALIIADEPTSSVDVSVQAQLLELLASIQRELQIAYLFISHNLAVVRHICDFVAVMYLGRVIEFGTRDEVFHSPKHPYTQALLDAVLAPDPRMRHAHSKLRGDPITSLPQLPGGCRFRDRCEYHFARCVDEDPPDYRVSAGHRVACHLHDPSDSDRASASAHRNVDKASSS